MKGGAEASPCHVGLGDRLSRSRFCWLGFPLGPMLAVLIKPVALHGRDRREAHMPCDRTRA